MLTYFARLSAGRIVLWCYLIWYLIVVVRYFDPSPSLWLNSLGISAVIGIALTLSVNRSTHVDRWQTFRLFLMPFCVSSFSSLIKERGFILIFPPDVRELTFSIAACLIFVAFVWTIRRNVAGQRA